jgi:diguanylate cyclase (GGDEF)-like protein
MEKVKTVNDLKRDNEFDKLTQLRNRNSYETDISRIENTTGMVLGLFDLFRLKTVNDNYSHDKGDEYITGAARILSKYFPEFIVRTDEHGKKQKVATGTRLYRTGGDEYVLITPDSLESVELRAQQAIEEVRHLDLGIPEEIGLNLGIVKSENNESVKQLTVRADELLREDKTAIYRRLGIDRRR